MSMFNNIVFDVTGAVACLLQSVQKVLSNLLIAHVELRSEESIDIQPYTHERKVEKIVVPMSEELKDAQEKLLQVRSNSRYLRSFQ